MVQFNFLDFFSIIINCLLKFWIFFKIHPHLPVQLSRCFSLFPRRKTPTWTPAAAAQSTAQTPQTAASPWGRDRTAAGWASASRPAAPAYGASSSDAWWWSLEVKLTMIPCWSCCRDWWPPTSIAVVASNLLSFNTPPNKSYQRASCFFFFFLPIDDNDDESGLRQGSDDDSWRENRLAHTCYEPKRF